MADGYLEQKRRDYEKRKAEWLKKKKHIVKRADNKNLTPKT